MAEIRVGRHGVSSHLFFFFSPSCEVAAAAAQRWAGRDQAGRSAQVSAQRRAAAQAAAAAAESAVRQHLWRKAGEQRESMNDFGVQYTMHNDVNQQGC